MKQHDGGSGGRWVGRVTVGVGGAAVGVALAFACAPMLMVVPTAVLLVVSWPDLKLSAGRFLRDFRPLAPAFFTGSTAFGLGSVHFSKRSPFAGFGG